MSTFSTSPVIPSAVISEDAQNPTTVQLKWPSFSNQNQYLMITDGHVVCPQSVGYVKFDYKMNGVQVNSVTRQLQNTENGSDPISTTSCLMTTNATSSTDADGNSIFNNILELDFVWVRPNGISVPDDKKPTMNGVCLNVIIVN